MKKLFLILLAVTSFTLCAVAQNKIVKGVVLTAGDDEPLIGATVLPVGGGNGTSTDLSGRFTLNVPQSVQKVKVSYVGMETQTVDITPDMIIWLKANDTTLDEVVVTGYGATRKAAFTGAASVVSGDVVDRKPDVNFVKSLEGQVTGFQYNNSTSMPGQWGSVYVRGMGSISSSSQPLYVVDGMPVNSDYDSMGSDDNNY